MNERIKQLAKQAGYMRHFEFSETQLEKFAELIVRECTNICEELGDKGLDGHYCVDKIKEHFGIQK
jgi:hypothetical protein